MKKKPTRGKTQKLTVPDCKHFTGYKPCFPGSVCLDECVDPQPRGTRILLINLDAMGNVLATTSLLSAIKRKYQVSTITWITEWNAYRLLDNNPYLDAVYVWESESWLILEQMKFDIVMNVDKSKRACAFAMKINAKKKFGFGLNGDGVIVPLNKEAEYNYRMGLDDHLKFRVNQKTVSQILAEAMGLKYQRDEYVLNLSREELEFCQRYKQEILGLQSPPKGVLSRRDSFERTIPSERSPFPKGLIRADNPQSSIVVGFNTGCSPLYPNKKMTIEQHVILIEELAKQDNVRLLLLGGPEDTERNAEIYRRVGDKVINTPTREGVRRGICYENLCDIVITGDSLGMHLAVALKKFVIVWFGVSCWAEIDLFDRGVKLIPEGLSCSPCWKRECPYNLECIQMIDLERIVREVEAHREAWDRGLVRPSIPCI